MSNNGATAIWSGYNHQGRVALLVALREANRVVRENSALDNEALKTILQQWSLRCEFKEDFEIVDTVSNSTYSRHQVKAYHSTDKSKYDKVFQRRVKTRNKMSFIDENGGPIFIDGFDCNGVAEDKRYLHVICDLDISGWDVNNYKIQLYEYPSHNGSNPKSYCELSKTTSDDEDEITQFVLVELQQLTGKEKQECLMLWQGLQHTFSVRLGSAHENKMVVQFSFDELLQLSTTDSSLVEYEGHKLQRQIEQYHEDFLTTYEDDPSLTDEMKERLADYVQKLIGLKPAELLKTVRYFNVDDNDFKKVDRQGLHDVVYEILSKSINFKYDPICIKSELNGKNYILTTITSLDHVSDQHRKGRNSMAVKRIVEALGEEDIALVFSKSNIINKFLSAPFAEMTNDLLETKDFAGRRVYNLIEDGPMAFVSVNDTIDVFERGGS